MARSARVPGRLHEVVAKDPGALQARADDVRRCLHADERELLESFLAGQRALPTDRVLHAAAILRMAALAPRGVGDRTRILQIVGDLVLEGLGVEL